MEKLRRMKDRRRRRCCLHFPIFLDLVEDRTDSRAANICIWLSIWAFGLYATMYLAPTLNEIVFAVANATHTNTTHTGNTTNDLLGRLTHDLPATPSTVDYLYHGVEVSAKFHAFVTTGALDASRLPSIPDVFSAAVHRGRAINRSGLIDGTHDPAQATTASPAGNTTGSDIDIVVFKFLVVLLMIQAMFYFAASVTGAHVALLVIATVVSGIYTIPFYKGWIEAASLTMSYFVFRGTIGIIQMSTFAGMLLLWAMRFGWCRGRKYHAWKRRRALDHTRRLLVSPFFQDRHRDVLVGARAERLTDGAVGGVMGKGSDGDYDDKDGAKDGYGGDDDDLLFGGGSGSDASEMALLLSPDPVPSIQNGLMRSVSASSSWDLGDEFEAIPTWRARLSWVCNGSNCCRMWHAAGRRVSGWCWPRKKRHVRLFEGPLDFEYPQRLLFAFALSAYFVVVMTAFAAQLFMMATSLFDYFCEVYLYPNHYLYPNSGYAVHCAILYGGLGASLVAFLVMTFGWRGVMANYRSMIMELRRGKETYPRSSYTITGANSYIGYQLAHMIVAWVLIMIFFVVLTVAIIILVLVPSAGAWFVAKLKGFAVTFATGSMIVYVVKYFLMKVFFISRGTIDNRRWYALFEYVNLYVSVITGIAAVSSRFFMSIAFNVLFFWRLDTSMFPNRMESYDAGYSAFVSMALMDHTFNCPAFVAFHTLLTEAHAERVERRRAGPEAGGAVEGGASDSGGTSGDWDGDSVEDRPLMSRTERKRIQVRNRWALAYTLVNNPQLKLHRTHYLRLTREDPLDWD